MIVSRDPMPPYKTCEQWAQRLLVTFSVLLLLAGSGCSLYSTSFTQIEKQLANRDPAEAIRVLDKQDYPKRDQLLYLLNRAMLLRLKEDYSGSNQNFDKAKALIDYLSAASISENTASLTINDSMRSYSGTPFEHVLLNAYAALNYLDMGDTESARVEALQADIRFRELEESTSNRFLALDPFVRYLGGLIYEAMGDWSNAMIDYRKAYEAYKAHGEHYPIEIPGFLKDDLLRCTKKIGLDAEHEEYKKIFNIESWSETKDLDEEGELIFLFHTGLAPAKMDRVIVLPEPSSGHLIQVAMPYYERRPGRAHNARIMIGDNQVNTQVVENIGEIAIQNLKAELPAIQARSIARTAARIATQAALRKQDKNSSQLLGLLVDVATALVEHADTRSWLTLPNQIQMSRTMLSAGVHDVEVAVIDSSGAILDSKVFQNVKVIRGKKTYLSYYWLERSR